MTKNIYLIAILILGFFLRVIGINFGLPTELHPDEGKLVYPAISMAVNFLDSLKGKGDYAYFNPHIFYYGGFSIYLLFIALKIYFIATNLFFGNYMVSLLDAFLIARLITLIFGVGTIFVVYKVAKQFLNESSALLSALLIAVFPTPVVLSHIFSHDVIATFFGITSFYFLIRKRVYVSAIALGLGVGTKYYPVLLMVVVLFFQFYKNKIPLFLKIRNMVVYSLLVFGFFLITNPHFIISFNEFFTDIKTQALRNSGGIMGASSSRFLYLLLNNDTSSLGKFIGNSVFSDLGPIAFVISIFSFIWVFIQKNRLLKLLGGFTLFYFCFVSFPVSKEMRWLNFCFPFFSIIFGAFLDKVFAPSRPWKLLGLLLVFIYPLGKSLIVANAFVSGDTRVEAKKYFESTVSLHTTVYSDPLLVAKPPFDDDKYKVIEISHQKYNVNNAFSNETPTPLPTNKTSPYFVVTNGKYLDYYSSSDFMSLFPEFSQKWISYYNNIRKSFNFVECFYSKKGLFNYYLGPDICIYNNET